MAVKNCPVRFQYNGLLPDDAKKIKSLKDAEKLDRLRLSSHLLVLQQFQFSLSEKTDFYGFFYMPGKNKWAWASTALNDIEKKGNRLVPENLRSKIKNAVQIKYEIHQN